MLRRPIACTLLFCYLAACTSWHVEEGITPQQFIATEHPSVVRLTRTDGSHTVLDEPRIIPGDTLFGAHHEAPVSVAASDVTQVAIRKFSAGKTIGLFAGMAAGLVIIAGIACSTGTVPCSTSIP